MINLILLTFGKALIFITHKEQSGSLMCAQTGLRVMLSVTVTMAKNVLKPENEMGRKNISIYQMALNYIGYK